MRWPFMNWLRGAPGRDDPAPGAPEGAPAAPAGGLSAQPDPGPGPRAESRPAAWRDLAPVQRTVGAAPLTAPSAAFARDLASRRAPDPILVPLGHDVTSDGPAGLVSGITVPLVQRAPSGSDPRVAPPMPSATAPRRGRPSVQRGVTTVATLPRRGAADPALGAGPDVPGLEDAGAEAAEAASSGISASDAPGPGLRALPVARLAAETPAIAATRVADASAPLPVLALARVIASESPPERDAATSTPVPTTAVAPGDATAGGQAAGEPAAGSRPNVAEVVPAEPSRPDDHPQVVARRTLGESRRLGLGAPLVGPPPSAARDTGRFDLPVARRARTGDAMLSTAPDPTALPHVVPAAAAPSPLPRLVVARRSATASATTTAAIPPIAAPAAPGAPGSSAAVSSAAGSSAPAEQAPSDVAVGSSTDASAGVTAADAPRPARPLVGESPIGVARLAREDQDTESDTEAAAEPGVGAPPRASSSDTVQGAGRPAGTTGPGWTSEAMLGGPGRTGGSEVGGVAAVQRAAAASTGVGSSAPVRPSATRSAMPAMASMVAARAMRSGSTASIAGPARRAVDESTPVMARMALPPFDTRAAYAAPGPDSTWAGHPGVPSAPGGAVRRDERPVVSRAALGASRGPTSAVLSALPLAHAAAGAAGSSWASGPDTIPAGQSGGALGWTPGAGFTSVAPTPGPFVQRAVQIDEVTVTQDGGGAGAGESGAAGAGQSGSTGAAAAAGGGAGTDYEELAEQVYDRIRARLTTELLLDRERAGTLVDG